MVDERKRQDLYNAFEDADTILLKKYVTTLDKCNIIPVDERITRIPVGSNVCLYHVDKIVYDKDENIQDKLTTVFTSLISDRRNSLVILLKGTPKQVDLYIGAIYREANEEGRVSSSSLENAGKTLSNVISGNFPGTELKRVDIERRKNERGEFITDNATSVMEKCFFNVNTIASVSGIATIRNHNNTANKEFVQGMEKLIDSMRGKAYTAIYLADVISNETVEEICSEYADVYSQLAPFKQSVHTLNESTSQSKTESFVQGVVNTTNESLAKSVTHGVSHSETKTNSFGGGLNSGLNLGLINMGTSVDYHRSLGKNEGESDSDTSTTSTGKAKSLTEQNSVANAITSGSGESLQITFDNRAVKSLLDRIDEQIDRLRKCEDFGMFDVCVYFLSDKYENAVSAASVYKSIIRGENSSVESSAINVWSGKTTDENITSLCNYLKRFYHPMFEVPVKIGKEDAFLPVSPALMVSGQEMAVQFALPKKSVSGLPVVECAEFGRNVMSVDGFCGGDMRVGKIYHMHHVEDTDVYLQTKNLTAHTFVTGSTGAGKSNTIYQLLTEITRTTNSTFMVVEPAKGEYKDIFGHNKRLNVSVYGTNPKLTTMLRINPFRFPATTHIYEHMDRLIEIFNVCWPMYAAMPAVLKAGLENAYKAAGWDLEKSENITGVPIFPTFASVAREVKNYIDHSEYSEENKGNYKGSLCTRLESMTNGISGMIFCADDIEDSKLFDQNVIIDLSRIGSQETKALIMGILVMRLQEYRSGTSVKNSKLKHVTVLEEAHNLLKKTAESGSGDGGNLAGKSVEMLSNSIAEMRTYGEAFIIADQAPGLLDMSVIRNTNTKIVLRLPDHSDRELVGRAANLNDEQIQELAKLKTGVAAVYQNDWITPVLCKFDRFEANEKVYINPDKHEYRDVAIKEVLNIIMKEEVRRKLDDIDYERTIIHNISISQMPDFVKVKLLENLVKRRDKLKAQQIAEIAYSFFDAEHQLDNLSNASDIEKWQESLIEQLTPSISGYDEREIQNVITMLVHEHYMAHKNYEPIYLSYMEYIDIQRNNI